MIRSLFVERESVCLLTVPIAVYYFHHLWLLAPGLGTVLYWLYQVSAVYCVDCTISQHCTVLTVPGLNTVLYWLYGIEIVSRFFFYPLCTWLQRRSRFLKLIRLLFCVRHCIFRVNFEYYDKNLWLIFGFISTGYERFQCNLQQTKYGRVHRPAGQSVSCTTKNHNTRARCNLQTRFWIS
jgi:hypothetical protein